MGINWEQKGNFNVLLLYMITSQILRSQHIVTRILVHSRLYFYWYIYFSFCIVNRHSCGIVWVVCILRPGAGFTNYTSNGRGSRLGVSHGHIYVHTLLWRTFSCPFVTCIHIRLHCVVKTKQKSHSDSIANSQEKDRQWQTKLKIQK